MAVWVVKHVADPPTYVAERDGVEVEVKIAPPHDGMAYWRAVQMMRANVMRRWGDEAPQFAANANEAEAVAFAEMLNA